MKRLPLINATARIVAHGSLLVFLLWVVVVGLMPYVTGYERVSPVDLLLEAFFVYLPVFLFFSVLTAKPVFALIMTVLVFLAWVVGGLIKNAYLGSTWVPSDFLELYELVFNEGFLIFKSFILPLVLAVFTATVMLRLIWKKERRQPALRKPGAWLLLALLVPWASGWYEKTIIGRFEPNLHNSLKQSVMHGFANHFLHLLWTNNAVVTPPGYSARRIQEIIDKYNLYQQADHPPLFEPTQGLITLIVESFTDPVEMGWQFSADPLKNFHRLQSPGFSGSVLSPVYGGKSVNAEFELLSGMSLAFVPAESKPYRSFLPASGIPALPDFLKRRGWQPVIGVQAVNIKVFFSRVFGILGFQRTISVDDEHAPRVPNGMPTTQYMFEQILELISSATTPAFYIHAFPNDTHAPWADHAERKFRLLNTRGLSQSQIRLIENYAHALYSFDQALGFLTEELKKMNSPVTVLVVGDHQPAIPNYARWQKQKLAAQGLDPETAAYVGKHTVPFLVWTNQHSVQKQSAGLTGSMNVLPILALKAIGVKPQGFMKLVAKVREKAPFSSQIFHDGRTFTKTTPEKQKDLLADYQMLQYDLLHGQQYYYHFMEQGFFNSR